MGERDERQYEKFKRVIQAMPIGNTLQFEYRLPRSPAHHRMFFRKVRDLLDRQSTFDNEDDLRAWLCVGAGYCRFLPGIDGQLVAIPLTMNWVGLDEVKFCELHKRIDKFMWELHARRVLWPHLGDERSYWAVDSWRLEFDRS